MLFVEYFTVKEGNFVHKLLFSERKKMSNFGKTKLGFEKNISIINSSLSSILHYKYEKKGRVNDSK